MRKPIPRRRVAGVAILLGAAVVGCGGAHKPSGQPTQPVIQAVRSYLQAQTSGDGQTACALLSASGQEQLISLVMQEGKGLVTTKPSCVDAVMLIKAVAGRQIIAALEDAQVEDVQIMSDHATAQVVDGMAFPSQQVSLQKVGGAWKIANVPGLGG
jgi:hypothetical protein